MLNVKQGSCEYQLFKSFGLTRPGNKPRSAYYEANALITESRASFVNSCYNSILLRENQMDSELSSNKAEANSFICGIISNISATNVISKKTINT